jgi:ATP phosphoribosyltransferase
MNDDPTRAQPVLHFALPKGRMQDGVLRLLADAGLPVRGDARDYRLRLRLADTETKLLKPQAIVRMLGSGTRDLGFTGADWVAELAGECAEEPVELLDTGLDTVRIVLAGPQGLDLDRPEDGWRVATEYPRLVEAWAAERGWAPRIVKSDGATEVYPPEDAEAIVDNTATGATLRANGLLEAATLMRSSTRLYASRQAWEDPARRARIEEVVLLLRSVVEARRRVMLEMNIGADGLDELVDVLPCMREPTVASLHGGRGFAVKAAVPRLDLPQLIPRLRAVGATDLLVSELGQLVP